MIVLDASAVLAAVNNERGADRVIAALEVASISTVNYAEVVTRMIDWGFTADEARMSIEAMGVAIFPYDEELALRTGELRMSTKRFGLSLADRACLALAERERAVVLTADRQWSGLDLEIDIQLIR
ncbi:MAG: type II toxin-antitoxin system VapC family toxin [Pseudolabrys sp.]|nr:type II toxin-antitoxin system VapC family toxin [Pseudolabrys sp.]